MKVITEYDKVGKYIGFNDGEYQFHGERNENGELFFKDEEAFVKDWNAPCYLPSYEFRANVADMTTECFETHKFLLWYCHLNERMCQRMFEQLNGEQPAEWLARLRSEDYVELYSFVKVGSKVFFHEPWGNIPMGFYEVNSIGSKNKKWSLSTSVFLKAKNCDGEECIVEAYLDELSETDIALKIKDK